jgi:hypothetical protein
MNATALGYQVSRYNCDLVATLNERIGLRSTDPTRTAEQRLIRHAVGHQEDLHLMALKHQHRARVTVRVGELGSLAHKL